MVSLIIGLLAAGQPLCGTPPVPQAPYVGVSYYPEVAGDEIVRDIRQMKEIGINMVRMGEFSWCRMEPDEGSYDFKWLHQAVDKLAAAGMAVVLCTPTATPPVWLSERHPDILRVTAAEQTLEHGARRHYCPNSPTYRKYSAGIAERLGDEFAKSSSVIAWQIDNEFWDDCFCPRCEEAFHAWLKQRFGTVEALNRAWLTVLWSQEYQSEADWMRPTGKRFWLAETAATHSAGTSVGDGDSLVFAPGALRAKMWLTYALGGEAVSFWLWRAHWAGQELEHGSLVYPWGDECANTGEIRAVAAELVTHADWMRTTHPKPAVVALHFGVPVQWQFEASPIADGFQYDTSITAFHRMLAESGVARDVIMPGAPVDRYQVVCSPYLPAIDADLMKRMRRFVEQGGTWMLGPLSACRTPEATAHRDACYGVDFEQWLGIHVRHRLTPGGVTKLNAGGETIGCRLWCDAYELRQTDRQVLAAYSGGPLDGLAAVVECPIGKGRVILLGTQPDDAWLRKLIGRFAPRAGLEAAPGIVVAERVTEDGKPAGAIIVNTRPQPATYRNADLAAKTLAGFAVEISPVPSVVHGAGRDVPKNRN